MSPNSATGSHLELATVWGTVPLWGALILGMLNHHSTTEPYHLPFLDIIDLQMVQRMSLATQITNRNPDIIACI